VKVYHLSAVPLGGRVILQPRTPRDPMLFENHSIRRVSVAPTIAGCLCAIRHTFYNRGVWWIYVIDLDDSDIMDPIHVPDAALTGERWILRPAEALYAGRVAQTLSCAC
jgi:hypothetical protein